MGIRPTWADRCMRWIWRTPPADAGEKCAAARDRLSGPLPVLPLHPGVSGPRQCVGGRTAHGVAGQRGRTRVHERDHWLRRGNFLLGLLDFGSPQHIERPALGCPICLCADPRAVGALLPADWHHRHSDIQLALWLAAHVEPGRRAVDQSGQRGQCTLRLARTLVSRNRAVAVVQQSGPLLQPVAPQSRQSVLFLSLHARVLRGRLLSVGDTVLVALVSRC